MRLLAHCPADAGENVALDATLFHDVEEDRGGETLRFWEVQERAVILGAFGSAAREVHGDVCRADKVPIVRRCSGGGAVVVARGCLNYSLTLSLEARPELRHVGASYRLVLGRIVAALGLPGLTIRGTSDLAIDGWKVSGSAQRRGRRALLHHGTLLYAFDVRSLARYLRQPPRQPAYRAGRDHSAFVTNVPVDAPFMKAVIAGAWDAAADADPRMSLPVPSACCSNTRS